MALAGNLLLVHVVRVATADSARGLVRFLFGKLAVPDLLVASVAGVSGRSCYLALFVELVSLSILYHEGAWGYSVAPSRFFCG